jgi:NAD(P)H-dependent FMN reductase
LFQVEAEASLLIANQDGNMVNAKIGLSRFDRPAFGFPPGAGHAADYTSGRPLTRLHLARRRVFRAILDQSMVDWSLIRRSKMLKIGIIAGSTRPGRKAAVIAKWVHDLVKSRSDAAFEVVDIEHYKLPLLDEPMPPLMRNYTKDHTKAWSAKIDSLDAFIFVTPEYNHATSAALKNAIDFLFHEWNDKAAGFVGYGGFGGIRAVENLRLVMGELKVADVRAQVALSIRTDFENFTSFKPHEQHQKTLHTMVDEVIAWGGALKTVRQPR